MIDLDAYFKRIGYSGDRKPTLAILREIHRLQPATIAFENLDPLLKRPVKLDPQSLEAKLVHGGRGGYCFEQNLLFAQALRAVGFDVREGTARVRWGAPPDAVTARTHAVLIVRVDGKDYLADVGFGGNVMTGPLLLESRDEQQTPHEPFRLLDEERRLAVQAKIAGEWVSLYTTDLAESFPADYEVANWFTATHPNSRFVTGLLAARSEPGRRYALSNNQLAVHEAGKTKKQTLRGGSDMRAALVEIFKLRLDGLDGLDAALARLAASAA